MSTNGSKPLQPGDLHPIWRCERCSAWQHRNGEPQPPCPWCSTRINNGSITEATRVLMWEAVRKVPEPMKGSYEA